MSNYNSPLHEIEDYVVYKALQDIANSKGRKLEISDLEHDSFKSLVNHFKQILNSTTESVPYVSQSLGATIDISKIPGMGLEHAPPSSKTMGLFDNVGNDKTVALSADKSDQFDMATHPLYPLISKGIESFEYLQHSFRVVSLYLNYSMDCTVELHIKLDTGREYVVYSDILGENVVSLVESTGIFKVKFTDGFELKLGTTPCVTSKLGEPTFTLMSSYYKLAEVTTLLGLYTDIKVSQRLQEIFPFVTRFHASTYTHVDNINIIGIYLEIVTTDNPTNKIKINLKDVEVITSFDNCICIDSGESGVIFTSI